MTNEEMLAKLKIMTGETDETILSVYLELAGQVIIQKAYPFDFETISVVPEKYHLKQLEVATYLYNKRGAEGQISHNENGINRGYESASVPDSMLKTIIPLAKVPYDKEIENESVGT